MSATSAGDQLATAGAGIAICIIIICPSQQLSETSAAIGGSVKKIAGIKNPQTVIAPKAFIPKTRNTLSPIRTNDRQRCYFVPGCAK